MPRRRPIRAIVAPVILLVLLVFAMTLGAVVHNHAGTTESGCSICHLNHQPIDQTFVADTAPSFAQIDVRNEAAPPADPDFEAAPRLPARAPPTA